jgi:DNA repair exonuclease SbcCD ATPase subunit
MRGYAIRSDTISCAMILIGNEHYKDVQALSILERLTERYKNDPPAAQDLQDNALTSLYQLIPESTNLEKLAVNRTIVEHTLQSIREVADRMGWVRSQLDSVESSATQIESLRGSLEKMLGNVSKLTKVLSRANKSRNTSSGLSDIEAKIKKTTEMVQEHGLNLDLYASGLEALSIKMKNVNVKQFDELQKDLISSRSMPVGREEIAKLNDFWIRTNEIQAELDDVTSLLPEEVTQLEHIDTELKHTVKILHKTIEELIERGEKVSSLTERSDRLAIDSASFRMQVCISIDLQR